MVESALIYLDTNATTPIAATVRDTIVRSMTEEWGNPSSHHMYGRKAKQSVEKARAQVAEMVRANASDIVFMSGGTEANHTVLEIFSSSTSPKVNRSGNTLVGDQPDTDSESLCTRIPHIITTMIEHDSIKRPLDKLVFERRLSATYVPINPTTFMVDVADVIKAIQPNTVLISVMLANNETGVIQPVADISKSLKQYCLEHKRNIYIHTDAAQAIGKIPVDVTQLDVHYLTIVGHKFYGPRIGALYVKNLGDEEDNCPFKPMFLGGGQERGFRSGTENTAMIAGLGAACEIVTMNITTFQNHFSTVRDYLEEALIQQFGKEKVIFNAKSFNSERLPNTCSVSFHGEKLIGHHVLANCPEIVAGVGAACHSSKGHDQGSAILRLSGVPVNSARNALRLSVGRDTTKNDIDRAVKYLWQAVKRIEDSQS